MLEKLLNLFRQKKRTVDSFLKYPDGKRYYREFHSLQNSLMDVEGMKIIQRLHKNKYKAYFVGGCIRDLLLNREPKDFDVVTNATPREIKKLFINSRIIGKRFKIVHVYFRSRKKPNEYKIIEVSTFRKFPEHRLQNRVSEIDHSLMRRDNIYGTPKEDIARRDFTINALLYDPVKEIIIDYTGGMEDIQNRIIRVIGPPDISYREDPVRMLRAIKFAVILNFKIEKKSLKAIKKHKEEILKVNKNRLLEEFMKIFKTGMSSKIIEGLYEHGLFDVLFPGIVKNSVSFLETYKKKKMRNYGFQDTLIYKRLQIADKLLTEREDLTFNIFFSLIIADSILASVLTGFKQKNHQISLDQQIKKHLQPVFQHLEIPGRDQERIFQIFVAHKQIAAIDKDEKGLSRQKIVEFKEKKYFFEAFMVFKIFAMALEDEELLQKALLWEIGPRLKPPEDSKIVSLYTKSKKYHTDNLEEVI